VVFLSQHGNVLGVIGGGSFQNDAWIFSVLV
jgi:hypothetical protein